MEVVQDNSLFKKIRQLSNEKKFRIIELTQKNSLDIGTLSKKVKLAFNKCSNYCTQLEKEGLIEKKRDGKNTLIQSKVHLMKESILFK